MEYWVLSLIFSSVCVVVVVAATGVAGRAGVGCGGGLHGVGVGSGQPSQVIPLSLPSFQLNLSSLILPLGHLRLSRLPR